MSIAADLSVTPTEPATIGALPDTFLSCYEISNPDDLRWNVRLYKVRRAGVQPSHAERGEAKQVKRRPAEVFAARGDPPVLLILPKGVRAIEPVNTVAEVRRIEDSRGRFLSYGLSWNLAADKIHNLFIDATTPLKAKSITFEYTNISWQAGEGWPVYHVRCPRDDYGQNFYYVHAKIHAIVHSIGNTYSISCLQSGIFTVNDPDQVRCAVNDGPGDYGDNRGTWDITISSWS